uniref:Uncharacterized protein n=1 Tax=Human herpesvirus 2 TaxID=10310 RepID=A0A481TNW5_HHV2|nr:hypothetical protein [Human alphaherpesvirus 2]QBH75769.1 hypothetical protein [Human alphaherpesvirus 2]QBH76021.1 hypothetical protein [Human alphaherpesvirus 2]QBH76156.1 hypothetical protein [Human alphaherpesvirus 2]QBH76270.1 hypothetical protein [Human alphaherpesvirus 2]
MCSGTPATSATSTSFSLKATQWRWDPRGPGGGRGAAAPDAQPSWAQRHPNSRVRVVATRATYSSAAASIEAPHVAWRWRTKRPNS